jgi:hypothetical protein
MAKEKIIEEGQSCNHCGTPVEKRIPRERSRGRRKFYFEYFFRCPQCSTNYLVESAKRFWPENSNLERVSPPKINGASTQHPSPDFSSPQNTPQQSQGVTPSPQNDV